MPRLTPNDGILEVYLARFLAVVEPPPADFTNQLPADVESIPLLISFVMEVLTEMGFEYTESISQELGALYHRALAIDFISVMKVERPDVIDSFLDALFATVSFFQAHPEQSTTQTQFHHYIPRFILKTFADNFSLNNSEFTTDISSPALSWFKPGKPSKLRRKVQPRYDINVYRVQDHTTDPTNVSRAYGAEDMYRDVTEDDCMKFENLLAKHECTASTFIRQIWKEEEDLSLTRTQLGNMKKFLVVMMYRSENRRSQYFNQSFDPITEFSIKKHMEHNKFLNVQEVWFENLKWIIETPAEDIVKEFHKAIMARCESGRFTTLVSPYLGPIHAGELEDFGCLMTQTIACIWQAETGSEFILSEGCFGAYEGDVGIWFHNFYIVSPRFAIVLVNRLYLAERMKKNPRWTSMFGDNLDVFPTTDYKKGPPPKDFDPEIHFAADDVFTYRRIVVPKEDVYKVNSIFLDDRRHFLTYKSSVSMYKTLRYYDKVKEELFHTCHDYSILRRQLFSDLNRTHPVDQNLYIMVHVRDVTIPDNLTELGTISIQFKIWNDLRATIKQGLSPVLDAVVSGTGRRVGIISPLGSVYARTENNPYPRVQNLSE
ncbi:hypothetical protein BGZ47_009936 [Haplosporangium gracile]|nr:hypothetical protein BGZ47_009936 [Haplosporangium gracile]